MSSGSFVIHHCH